MDFALSRKNAAEIAKPEGVPVLFESVLLVRNATSGFYGFPTKSAPKSDANSFIVADDTVTELVPVDPDGFTELDSAAAVGVEPTSE